MRRSDTLRLRWAPLLSVLIAACVSLLLMSGGVACDDDQATRASLDGVPDDSRPLTFTTEDGVVLGGHLFGSGNSGVILAHMYPANQTSWYATAEKLADMGYLVLTFDFRGYGESGGSKDIEYLDRDVIAAISAISDAGASRVLLVGASMGGTACLIAASDITLSRALSSQFPAPGIPVAGVVTLSAPVEFRGLSAAEVVPELMVPLLFIAAEDDVGAEGARELQQLSRDRGDMQILPGEGHGTNLFDGEAAEQAWDLLVGFLNKNANSAP